MRRRVPPERRPTGGEAGLDSAEAVRRLERFGPNDVAALPARRWRMLAAELVKDAMLWFLLAMAVVYAVLGERAEAISLAIAIVPLGLLDVFLHWRTQASLRGLSGRLATTAHTWRDGGLRELPASGVVPGDLVEVTAGEHFPADGVLVEASEVQVDESALSGESLPVRKRALPPAARAEVDVDEACWGMAGTQLLTGRARLVVVYTGAETRYGEIVRSALTGAGEITPLQRAVRQLVTWLLAIAAALCAVLFAVRLAQGWGWLDAIVSAASLAVAALPEEFPVAVAAYLGAGALRLARRRALVRRAVAVEDLGRVTALLIDKTGTVTEGRLRLAHLLPVEAIDRGELLHLAALACRRDADDPWDRAILERADAEARATGPAVLERIPFTEDRLRESVRVARDGAAHWVTKGAPEWILERTRLPPSERATWLERAAELAASAHRVLACATHPSGGEPEPTSGLELCGLLACEDPVRPGVAEAVSACRRAGLRVLLVTGDHPAAALAVARESGLGGAAPRAVLGCELARLSDDALTGVDVVARATPAHKASLVQALRRRGERVAVTGDGVNDVPALQAADVGIAMGERATRTAREIASIVLLEADFGTLVAAIAEGQQLFRELQRSFQYLVAVHLPLVLSATLVPLAGYPLLYLPLHLVWLEALIHPTALLAFHRSAAAPRLERPGERHLLGDRHGLPVLAAGLLLAAVAMLAYARGLGATRDVLHARALALAVVATGSTALGAVLSELRTRLARTVCGLGFGLSLLLLGTPLLAGRLHLVPLHPDDLALAVLGGALAATLPLLLPLRRSPPVAG